MADLLEQIDSVEEAQEAMEEVQEELEAAKELKDEITKSLKERGMVSTALHYVANDSLRMKVCDGLIWVGGVMGFVAPRTGRKNPMLDINDTTSFYVEKENILSNDYKVYVGEHDESNRSLVLNKDGDWKSGDAYLEILNFFKETNGVSNKSGKGQCQWKATFDQSPNFKQHLSWGKGKHERFHGFFDGYESEDDQVYFDRQAGEKLDNCFNKFVAKWSVGTKAIITPGKAPVDADGNELPADDENAVGLNYRPGLEMTLRVFAKGTATRVVTKRGKDKAGNRIYENDDNEFVDWIEYKLEQGDKVIAAFRVKGGRSETTIECPLFSVTKEGGLYSKNPIKIVTKDGWDPLLCLLIAHLCTTEYSPAELRSDFECTCYPKPKQFKGSKRPVPNTIYDRKREAGEKMVNATAFGHGTAIEPQYLSALSGFENSYFRELGEGDFEVSTVEKESSFKAIDWTSSANKPKRNKKPLLQQKQAEVVIDEDEDESSDEEE